MAHLFSCGCLPYATVCQYSSQHVFLASRESSPSMGERGVGEVNIEPLTNVIQSACIPANCDPKCGSLTGDVQGTGLFRCLAGSYQKPCCFFSLPTSTRAPYHLTAEKKGRKMLSVLWIQLQARYIFKPSRNLCDGMED